MTSRSGARGELRGARVRAKHAKRDRDYCLFKRYLEGGRLCSSVAAIAMEGRGGRGATR